MIHGPRSTSSAVGASTSAKKQQISGASTEMVRSRPRGTRQRAPFCLSLDIAIEVDVWPQERDPSNRQHKAENIATSSFSCSCGSLGQPRAPYCSRTLQECIAYGSMFNRVPSTSALGIPKAGRRNAWTAAASTKLYREGRPSYLDSLPRAPSPPLCTQKAAAGDVLVLHEIWREKKYPCPGKIENQGGGG